MSFIPVAAAFMVGFFAFLSPMRPMAPEGHPNDQEQEPACPTQSKRKGKCEHAQHVESLQVNLDDLVRQYEELKKDHEHLQSKHQKLGSAKKALEVTCDGLRNNCREERSAKETAVRAYNELRGTHIEALKQMAVLKKTEEGQEQALGRMRETISNKDSLLQTRSAELREAQAFLSTTDRLSHAEVLAMVQAVNAQLHQTAAQIADLLQLDGPRVSARHLVVERQWVEKELGGGMAGLVFAMRGSGDPTAAQMAIQASLCASIASTCASWSLNFKASENELLDDIYDAVYIKESSAVCGKWKELTRRHAKLLSDQVGMPAYLRHAMIDSITAILLLAGETRADASRLHVAVDEKFGSKLASLAASSIELEKALGEDVIASDIQVVCPFFEDKFVDEDMEDESESGRPTAAAVRPTSHRGRVLCTTELGLRRSERRTTKEGKAEEFSVVMLKPRVLLTSFAKEMTANGI